MSVDTNDKILLRGKEYVVTDIQVTISSLEGDVFSDRTESLLSYLTALEDGTIKLIKRGSDNNRIGATNG